MDDLLESSGSWDYMELNMTNDNETYETYMGETPLMSFWVNGVLHTVISISGIISNLTCITILLCYHDRLKYKPAFANLLILLSLFYICDLAAKLANYSAPTLSSYYMAFLSPIVYVNTYPLAQIAFSGSLYTLMAIALERYLNICKHANYSVWHHMWRGWGYMTLVIVAAVFFNINSFFEFTYGTYRQTYCADGGCEGEEYQGMLFISATSLRKNPIYNILSIGFNIFEVVVSLIVLALLTCKTLSTMRMQLKESDSLHRDGAMVDILTGLVFVFITCTTPLLLFTIYEWISFIIIYNDYNYDYYEGWKAAVIQLVNLLLSASHALNIFVFCCQDKMFRALLLCQGAEVEPDLS